MSHKVSFQPVAKIRSGRKSKNAPVVNQSYAAIPALQRNKPAPPAISHEVIRRPLSHRPTWFRKVRSCFPNIGAIEIGDVAKTRPNRMDRMGVQDAMEFQFPSNQSGSSRGVDHPSCGYQTRLFGKPDGNLILSFSAQLQVLHFGGTPKVAPGAGGFLQNRFVKR